VRDITARKEADAELARRAEQQGAVAELGRRALANAESQALAQEAVCMLRETLEVEHASVLELQPDGKHVLVRAGLGWRDGVVGATLPLAQAPAARLTLECDGPVVVGDLRGDARFDDATLLHEHGVVSGMSAAIEGRDGPHGVLGVHTTTLREFGEDDINVLQAIANVLGSAITREREEKLQAHLERSQRVEAVGQLAGGIAHDFNNLLAVILNYTQFALEQTEGQPELRSDLLEIESAGERASELTRQLLVFSRQELLDTQVVDLNALILDAEGMLRSTLGDDVALRSDLADGLWETRVGAGQPEQILVNLAINAREAMADGGVLTVKTENIEFEKGEQRDVADAAPGRFVRLTVADSGTGMSEEVARRAFDLFYTTKPTTEGKGLGLATVYWITRQLGGFVRLYSEPETGTALKVYLPAADPVDDPSPSADDPVPLGSGETVLLVEDEEPLRRLTGRILTENGYEVVMAEDVGAALERSQASTGEIDLLLTDVAMPGLSGVELADRVRLHRPGLAILFMSGYAGDVKTRPPSANTGSVLEKPFSSGGLLRSVHTALLGEA
jgi:signal transduction histidine kinase